MAEIATNWRDFSTAPKTGVKIIVLSVFLDLAEVTFWIDKEERWANWCFESPPDYWVEYPYV